MAKVPTYERRVATQPLPDTRTSIRTTPADFGGQVADAAMGVMSDAAKMANDERDRVNGIMANAAAKSAMDLRNGLLNGSKDAPGVLATQGLPSVAASDKALKGWKEGLAQIRSGLKTEAQRIAFDAEAGRLDSEFTDAVNRHVMVQTTKADADDYGALNAGRVEAVSNDPAKYAGALAEVETAAREFAKRNASSLGMDPELWVKGEMRKYKNAIHVAAVTKMAMDRDFAGAWKHLAKHESEIEIEDRVRINGFVQSQEDSFKAAAAKTTAINTGIEMYQTLTEMAKSGANVDTLMAKAVPILGVEKAKSVVDAVTSTQKASRPEDADKAPADTVRRYTGQSPYRQVQEAVALQAIEGDKSLTPKQKDDAKGQVKEWFAARQRDESRAQEASAVKLSNAIQSGLPWSVIQMTPEFQTLNQTTRNGLEAAARDFAAGEPVVTKDAMTEYRKIREDIAIKGKSYAESSSLSDRISSISARLTSSQIEQINAARADALKGNTQEENTQVDIRRRAFERYRVISSADPGYSNESVNDVQRQFGDDLLRRYYDWRDTFMRTNNRPPKQEEADGWVLGETRDLYYEIPGWINDTEVTVTMRDVTADTVAKAMKADPGVRRRFAEYLKTNGRLPMGMMSGDNLVTEFKKFSKSEGNVIDKPKVLRKP